MKEEIILEQKDQQLAIFINRPEVYNALNKETKAKLTTIFNKVSNDTSVNSVVITGMGKAFCTGQDLNDRKHSNNSKNSLNDLGNTLEKEWNPLISSMRSCNKIIIAALNGVCAGAGVSIALNSDLIVSGPEINFVSAFTKIGLVPDSGATSILTKTIGAKRTMQFLLLPEKLKAKYLFDCGLINWLENEPLNFAKKISKQINNLAPLACQHLKRNIINAGDVTFNESLTNEVKSQTLLGKSDDFNEGVNAFFEKRSANFKGN